MADETPQETPVDTAPESTADESAPDDLGDPGKRALEAERTARKEAERARKALERELEQLRTASLSESERAVAEAEQRGRSAATAEFGLELARTSFLGEAARRNPGYDAAAVLDDLNLSRYIGDDGRPDSKELAKAVARLIPEASTTPSTPSFDGGTRQAPAATTSMTQLIRGATGRS